MIFNLVWLPARQTGSSTRTKVLLRIMLRDTTACEDDLVKQALNDLQESPIQWGAFASRGEVVLADKKRLRQHQEDALREVRAGLSEADRGKLIMACGTGKTFTSLKIAEDLVGKEGILCSSWSPRLP